MKKVICISLVLLVILFVGNLDGKKTGRSRSSSSSRGSSRKTATNVQPVPTSFSNVQAAAPKSAAASSFSGWQQKPASSHSYPSSQTGLSGNNKQQSHSYPQNVANSNQPSHSYPSSGGLSGHGAGYPQQGSGLSGNAKASGYPQQQGGLSGSGYPQQHGQAGYSGNAAGYPQHQGSGYSGGAPPPYPGNTGYANRPNSGYPNNNYHHPQGPPPPYYSNHGPAYGGMGSYHQGYGAQSPGYFGNYGNNGRGFGSVGRTSALSGIGMAGAGIGTVLTGLALWNLARSTGHRHNTVIYDNRGQPIAVAPVNSTTPVEDPILKDLVNCSLTIESINATEILAIPCSIATSFSPEATLNDPGMNNNPSDKTNCTVTVVTESGQEFMTTIPCSTLLNTAAENNVTEPPQLNETNVTNDPIIAPNGGLELNQPTALPVSGHIEVNKTLDCVPEPGDIRDPINPCYSVKSNITVIPLPEKTEESSTPIVA